MTLHAPFEISSRLMASLRVGTGVISLGYGKTTDDGRMKYEVYLDLRDGREFQVLGLCSGVNAGGIQEGFESLLDFLGAAAESLAYEARTGRPGENASLFQREVTEWASRNSDEISALKCEIEGRPLIRE